MIREMTLADGSVIYVEVEEVEALPASAGGASNRQDAPSDLPEGANPTHFEGVRIGAALFKDTIEGVVNDAFAGLKRLQPDELTVEFAVGAKAEGKTLIPVLLSGSGEANLKITAKWVKAKA